MDPGLRLVLLCALSPLLMLVVHIAASRFLSSFGRQPLPQTVAILSIAVGWCLTMGAACVLILRLGVFGANVAFGFLYAANVCGALGYAYFHLFNMSETARRIRLLFEILQSRGITPRDLESRYRPQEIIKARLERFVASGQLCLREGRYYVKGKSLLWAAELVAWWARMIGFPHDFKVPDNVHTKLTWRGGGPEGGSSETWPFL